MEIRNDNISRQKVKPDLKSYDIDERKIDDEYLKQEITKAKNNVFKIKHWSFIFVIILYSFSLIFLFLFDSKDFHSNNDPLSIFSGVLGIGGFFLSLFSLIYTFINEGFIKTAKRFLLLATLTILYLVIGFIIRPPNIGI